MTAPSSSPTIYTIGHSTHPIEQFIAMLTSHSVSLLVDVRNFPSSRRFPHFNKDALQQALIAHNIQYQHMAALGGRRKPSADSINNRWRNSAFRGYADYMSSHAFTQAVSDLEKLGSYETVAYMCAEAVWWSCHRSLISDYLKIRGWKVLHIMGENKATEHPYTSAARIADGQLRYDEPGLF